MEGFGKMNNRFFPKTNGVFSFCFLFMFFYSEENVWKICEQIKKTNQDKIAEYHVVFISNNCQQVSFETVTITEIM